MNLQRIAKILESKNDLVINEVVLDKAQKDNQVVYGARAFNSQSPSHLKKKTYDYDVLTDKPKSSAKEVAEILRRRLGKETKVIKGRHRGTYRVTLEGEPVVDYTQMKFKPKTKKILGNEYRDLKSIKRNARRLSNKQGLEYRREKDLDTISRIKEIERLESFKF